MNPLKTFVVSIVVLSVAVFVEVTSGGVPWGAATAPAK